MIEAVGIVVPAHNEETLLPAGTHAPAGFSQLLRTLASPAQ